MSVRATTTFFPLATYPELETPAGDNWLEQMIHKGAAFAHEHYAFFVEAYDLERGRKRPKEGLNDELRERLGLLFGHAIVGMSRILERIFQDAQAKPPQVRIGMLGLLTKLTSPFGKFSQFRASRVDRKVVRRIYREYIRTGCVIENLPADEREVRRTHAEEVLGISEGELNRLTREAAAQRMGVEAEGKKQQRDAEKAAKAEDRARQKQDAAARTAAAKRGEEGKGYGGGGPRIARWRAAHRADHFGDDQRPASTFDLPSGSPESRG